MKSCYGRYKHAYRGRSNSRGQRTISKICSGTRQGDLTKIFQEIKDLTSK